MINQHELQMGIKDEMEHTGDSRLAEKIALDHLRSDPKYYTKLHNAGLEQDEGAMTPLERGMDENVPLSSSGLGKAGVGKSTPPKPLKSDELKEYGVDIAVVKVDNMDVGQNNGKNQNPLTSSGLGKAGVGGSGSPKPLKSDNLGSQAPKGNNVLPHLGKTPPKTSAGNPPGSEDKLGNQRPNNVAIEKTPSMGNGSTEQDSNSNFDAMDFFGGQISKALRAEVPRRMEMNPANVSEGGAQLKKK